MLSDQWFAERFMEIQGQLSTIQEGQRYLEESHKRDIGWLGGRVTKVEKKFENCIGEPLNDIKDWKFYSKKYSPVGAAVVMLGYIAWDIYLKIKGGG
jgi:hypothetical protein